MFFGGACRASLGIILSENDGSIAPFWKARHDLETRVDGFQLLGHPHPHMPIHPFGRAFWMKTYEIQRRSRLAGRVVSSVGAMIEKRPQEICRTIISWAGAVGPTDGCFRDSAAHRFSRKIIQLEVFLRCSMPVENIRFVPNLPSPRFHGSVAIPFPQVQTWRRSEEHTSELQSHSDLVCRLLLEKKKTKQ